MGRGVLIGAAYNPSEVITAPQEGGGGEGIEHGQPGEHCRSESSLDAGLGQPSGQSTGLPPLWAIQAGAQVAEQAVARRAAEEAAARAEAERKLAEMQAAEAAYMASYAGGGENGLKKKNGMKKKGNTNTRAITRAATASLTSKQSS